MADFMPAPEANKEEVFAYLMRRNASLLGMAFALGPEDAVYLVGRVPARLIDDDELDRIAGASAMRAHGSVHPSTLRCGSCASVIAA